MSIFDKDLVERKLIPPYERYIDWEFEPTHNRLFYLDFKPWFEIDDEEHVDEGEVSK